MSDWMHWVGFAFEKLLVMAGTILVFLILGGLFVLVILVAYRLKTRHSGIDPPWPDSITEQMAKAKTASQPLPRQNDTKPGVAEELTDDPPDPVLPD